MNRLIITITIALLITPTAVWNFGSTSGYAENQNGRSYDDELFRGGPGSRSTFFGNETTTYELDTNSDIEIEGASKWDASGSTLAVGDIDGDGKADLIVGAPDAASGPSNDRYAAGEIYVLFGDTRAQLTNTIDLSSRADVVIYGSDEFDYAGSSLASGDINGDGRDDIIIGIPEGDGVTNSEGQEDTGEVMVIYGGARSTLGTTIDLANDYDIILYGRNTKDYAGSAVTVGDLDNDNFDDLVIAADHGDGPIGKRSGAGDVYVFYGKSKFSKSLKCANADFSVYGSFWGDALGSSLAVSDIDSDLHDDLLLGAPYAFTGTSRNRTFGGECYAIFGGSRASLGKSLDLSNRSFADITIYGGNDYDHLGSSVGLADLDGDGYNELIMGASGGDGPTSSRSEAGNIYVLRGSNKSQLNATIDLQDLSAVDMVIYGADPRDKAGETLSTGEFNGDGVMDLLIGAKVADGKQNDLPSAGEVYVIYGNISLSSGTERDLGGSGPDLVVYSTQTGQHAGYAVTAGDIDGDGKDDIIIGAPYSDTNNGTVTGAGKTYVVYGTHVLKRLKNIGLRVDGVSDRHEPVCYAEYQPYSFVVNITDSIGISDIRSVKLTLDPGGAALELSWDEQTEEFRKGNDPDNYIQLESTSKDCRRLTGTLLELTFRVTFSGYYPDEGYHDVSVFSQSDGGLKDSDIYARIYRVENDLDYSGTLSVSGAYQGTLTSGSWVQSNESVSWSGLTVVYEGTANVYPPDSYFELFVENDDGLRWYNRSSSAKPFIIVTVSDAGSDFSDFHTLTITSTFSSLNMPDPIEYELKVATPNITFSSPGPSSDVWFNIGQLECSITVSDLSGGAIMGSSIQYAVSFAGPTEYGSWRSAGAVFDNATLRPAVNVSFADGADNYIKWRAKSTIGTTGNIYSGSEDYRVKIDISPVYFSNARPEQHLWQPELQVACGITITDNLTSVDAGSIEYAYSSMDVHDLNRWISAGLSNDLPELTLEVPVNFLEGTENYIIWRANDVIDNGYVTSPVYRVKVSTQKPVATLFLPHDGSDQSTTEPVLTWSGFDPNGDTIYFDIYMGTDLNAVSSLDPSLMAASGRTSNELRTFNLQEGVQYYWTVIPSDGIFTGYCESGVWSFFVSLEVPAPAVNLKVPLNQSITNRSEVELIWSAENYPFDYLDYYLYLDVTPIPLKLHALVSKENKAVIKGLEENVRYYWTVVPAYNENFGMCRSGIWSFTIDVTYEQSYAIELALNASQVTIEWNTSWVGHLLLSNHGNGVDSLELNLFAGALGQIINISLGQKILQPLEELNLTVIISIPDSYPVRIYNVLFQVRSEISGQKESAVLYVAVEGTEQYYKGWEDYIPPGDGGPFDGTDEAEELPILFRNILITAFGLVMAIALTLLLIIRHSLIKANERAVTNLKKLIEQKRRKLKADKREPGSAKPVNVKSGSPTGTPQVQHRPLPAAVSRPIPNTDVSGSAIPTSDEPDKKSGPVHK